MTWVQHVAANAPEVFLLLAVALGTLLGRIRIRGFPIGATASTLVVAVILGQLATFEFPALLKSILFGLFVFTIGFRSGPEFFASLNLRTFSQVALALVMGATGLGAILLFAYTLDLDAGIAAGLGAGSLTQTSMMGTASGALQQLGLDADVVKQLQANVAAGYAVTYVCGYILVLLFVPLIAPLIMGIDLKREAAKLELAMSSDRSPKSTNLLYRKFQARAYQVAGGAGRSVGDIEGEIGRRVVIERILRCGADVDVAAETVLHPDDEVLLAGPSAAMIAAGSMIGPEIEGEHLMRSAPGASIELYVTASDLHGRTLADIVENLGTTARGVFLRSLTRHEQEVPIAPGTRIYVGDVMTLAGLSRDLDRLAPHVGQVLRSRDHTDMAFLCAGLAVGLLAGLLSFNLGAVPLTLGGGGGALVSGLVCGWLRSRRPTIGSFPPAAQQTLSDFGLGGFVASIGLVSGPAALAAVAAHGWTLLGAGVVVTLTPLIVGTLFAHGVLRMNPVITCGALAGAMTVDAAVSGCCEVAESQTPVLGVAVPYAVANVVLTVLGPIIVGLTAVR